MRSRKSMMIDEESLFGQKVADLFALTDGENFLDQLTGAEHAQYLQLVLWSTPLSSGRSPSAWSRPSLCGGSSSWS